MPTPLRPLIYNLTRLYSRQHSATPTGIDRLDLRHAHFVLAQAERRVVIFVHQQRDVLRRIPPERATLLINNLWQRWVLGHPIPPLAPFGMVYRGFRWLAMRVRRRLGLFIAPEITRRLKEQPAPIFLNSAHIGTQHLALHKRLTRELGADVVFYLHDLIPIDYPEYFSNNNGAVTHRKRVATMARTGSTVLVNSHYTRQRFQQYCTTQGLPTPEVKVLPIGVEEHFVEASSRKLELPARYAARLKQPYFLTLGTIEPRKNHLLLLHLWRKLRLELGERCPRLVIVGKRGWKNDLIIDLLERSPLLKDCVIELNDVNDHEAIALLQNTLALLFPSFEEGWGMPLAEALTLGTPAICSDIPAFHECGQELPVYLDPLDGPAWLAAITTLLPGTTPASDAHPAGNRNLSAYVPTSWPEHLHALSLILDDCGQSPSGE